MDRKLHLLETFSACDEQGRSYKVKGYEHMLREELFMGSAEEHWEPTGQAEYRLDSGECVDMLRDGSMRIRDSGVVLTRQ